MSHSRPAVSRFFFHSVLLDEESMVPQDALSRSRTNHRSHRTTSTTDRRACRDPHLGGVPGRAAAAPPRPRSGPAWSCARPTDINLSFNSFITFPQPRRLFMCAAAIAPRRRSRRPHTSSTSSSKAARSSSSTTSSIPGARSARDRRADRVLETRNRVQLPPRVRPRGIASFRSFRNLRRQEPPTTLLSACISSSVRDRLSRPRRAASERRATR